MPQAGRVHSHIQSSSALCPERWLQWRRIAGVDLERTSEVLVEGEDSGFVGKGCVAIGAQVIAIGVC